MSSRTTFMSWDPIRRAALKTMFGRIRTGTRRVAKGRRSQRSRSNITLYQPSVVSFAFGSIVCFAFMKLEILVGGTVCYKNVIKKPEMGNTIITLLSLLKVKQGFISSMDHCGIYTKRLIQITN